MILAFLTAIRDFIPDPAWGFIGGAALTLFTTRLTNRHNLKQQRQQFEFEREERQRERQVQLRRDVYLPAIDAVTAMSSVLGRLAAGDPPDEEVSKSGVEFAAALARVQMVCSPESLGLVAEVQRAYLATMIELQKRKFPMKLRGSEINIAKSSRDDYHAERMKCIELMKEYNLTGSRDPPRWEMIQQRSKFASKHWREAHIRWTRLMIEQETERLELLKDFLERARGLVNVQAPAQAALRGELETTISAKALAEEADKTSLVAIGGIKEMIPILEATLATMRRDAAADEAEGGEED